NFEKLMQSLHYYETLHAVLFIVKGTEARKTAFFKYCITELLKHLHKSISENIVLCFTHSSPTFGPGDGFSVLNGYLSSELKVLQLEISPKSNCFFIDNEGYRCLVAERQGYEFTKRQRASFEGSWETSAEQVEKMFKYIIDRVPHDLTHTLSLNNSRKL